MNIKSIVRPIICILLLAGCQTQQFQIEGFEQEIWRADTNGCQGQRISLSEKLAEQKNKLIGLSEQEIRGFLGKPDKVELFVRSQKFYVYYIEPGKQCGGVIAKEGRNFYVRFNSVNTVSEITLVLPYSLQLPN